MSNTKENKSNWQLALLLSIVCLDRLYLGQTKSGIVKVSFIPIFLSFSLNLIHNLMFWKPALIILSMFALFLLLIAFFHFAYWYVYDIARIVTHRENLSRVITSSKAKSNKSTSKERLSNAKKTINLGL